MNKISPTGYWDFDKDWMSSQHRFDRKLFNAIGKYVWVRGAKPSIVDVGCGHCYYVNNFLELGYDVTGMDGNPSTKQYCSDPNRVSVQDLAVYFDLNKKFDVVLCLEVGEHIPEEYESVLISNLNNLVAKNGTLILSWAVPGQEGLGHVNCRNNSYIKNKFKELGFDELDELEQKLRRKASLNWFKQTIMAFRKS